MSQVTNYEVPSSDLDMAELATSLKNIFTAIASANRGATAPSNPFEGMMWIDSSTSPVETFKRYTVAVGWVGIFSVNITTGALSFLIPDAAIVAAMIAANAVTADKIAAGAYASQAEAEAGEVSGKIMTPQRTSQEITALVHAKANTFSKAQRTASTALTSTSNHVAINLELGNGFSHTLTENTTIDNPTNIVADQGFRISLTQAASPKTVAYGSYFVFPAGVVPSVSTGSGAKDDLYCVAVSATEIHANLVKGFA